MWNELAKYRNHYLQAQLPRFKSEHINDLVTKDFTKAQEKRDICGKHDQCEKSSYFDDRAKLAYGWFALPKLMREVCSDDDLIQWRAINSLSEFLANPLQAQRAITETDTVRLAQNIFLRLRRRDKMKKFRETARMLHIFYLLSIYLNGSEQIARRTHLLNEIYKVIINEEKHEGKASKILRNMSEKPSVLLYMMNETQAFQHLAKIFQQDPCRPHYPEPLWVHLGHFLEISPEKAIESGFFELLFRRIHGQVPDYHLMNMKCFALLIRCEEGQRRFDNVDGIGLLHNILTTRVLNTCEYVVQTLLQGLVSKPSLWRSREYTDLPVALVSLAQKTHNAREQLYCLQTLRQLGEMPTMKKYIETICMNDLEVMTCHGKMNECTRDELVLWLNRRIYDTTDIPISDNSKYGSLKLFQY